MHRAFRCLSCGGQILAVERMDEGTPPNVVSWTVTVAHEGGVVDAACRLILETLADELRAELKDRVRRAAGILG